MGDCIRRTTVWIHAECTPVQFTRLSTPRQQSNDAVPNDRNKQYEARARANVSAVKGNPYVNYKVENFQEPQVRHSTRPAPAIVTPSKPPSVARSSTTTAVRSLMNDANVARDDNIGRQNEGAFAQGFNDPEKYEAAPQASRNNSEERAAYPKDSDRQYVTLKNSGSRSAIIEADKAGSANETTGTSITENPNNFGRAKTDFQAPIGTSTFSTNVKRLQPDDIVTKQQEKGERERRNEREGKRG